MSAHEVYYKAMASRDKRFDGKFYAGVKTTGIYCRPICPAPCPKRENVNFYATAASAREAGFRPCLRCHPESAPHSYDWEGSPALLSQALRLITEGFLDQKNIEDLAASLGISPRHLRRLFQSHLGTSPLAVAQTRRLHFAKKLIDETGLSFTQITHAAGFSSIRTFNNLIKNTFHQTPTQLRKNQPPAKNNGLTLKLSYRPPYDWAHMLAYLSRRAIPGVESVSSAGYRRTVALGGESGWIEVIPEPEQAALRLQVPSELGPHLSEIVSRTRHLFDLEADPMAINAALADDPRLAAAVGDRPGLRVPGAWDEFELAARAVAGQQITVTGAGQLLGRLAARCGKPLPDAGLDTRAFVFPSAGDIVGAALDGGGLTAARRTALQALAADLHANGPWRERWLDLDQAVGALTGFPGVGPWTAHYIAMRALAFPDAFPAGDLWLRKAFAPEPSQPLSEQALTHMAEDWRPWRAYAAVHIWANL